MPCAHAGVSYDKTARVWDVHTLECKVLLPSHTEAVGVLATSKHMVMSSVAATQAS